MCDHRMVGKMAARARVLSRARAVFCGVMFGFLKKLLSGRSAPSPRAARAPAGTLGVGELARRLGVSESELRGVAIAYHRFELRKRGGGVRVIDAPDKALK